MTEQKSLFDGAEIISTYTLEEAIDDGADFIVVGRPVIEAKDPVTAVRDILKEIS